MALPTPPGYRAFDESSLPDYLAGIPSASDVLGGSVADWRVREIGDGNLNLVFIVDGPAGGLCVKQALPYVRLVGEGWPLPLERAFFECQALAIQAQAAPGSVPVVHHYDPECFLIVMELLRPHIIMRRGMIDAVIYPDVAAHLAEFAARSLYLTSDLALPAAEKKALIARFAPNTELCKITEDLIFTDPYTVSARNRWTSPQLDEAARRIREDAELKVKVSALKLKFMSEAQALLHGDLHTGSIMVTPGETRVIDPEFAFMGPMGFDVGKLIGNLLLSHLAQRGHERRPGERDAYRVWILETVEQFWRGFESRFLDLWQEHPTGDAYPATLFADSAGAAALEVARADYMRALLTDALGYAGCSMIRRTLGLAHNADLETIEDPDRRAACEHRVLDLAVHLIKQAAVIADIAEVMARAQAFDAD